MTTDNFEGDLDTRDKTDIDVLHEIGSRFAAADPLQGVLGRVVDFVRSQPIARDTLIVLTADHGESLGEWGLYFMHGPKLNEAMLRIPLIFSQPGRVAPDRVRAPVLIIDVMPTILDWLGVPPGEDRSVFSGASLVGLPLMRLSGLAAGIATFAVLEITHNVLRYYEKVGPGLNTFSSVPETTDLQQAALGALVVFVIAFAYQRSRFGRQLRAAREDPAAARAVGVSIYRQRLAAFALSGFLAGLAGGLIVPIFSMFADLGVRFLIQGFLAVLLGGVGTFEGPALGAAVIGALSAGLPWVLSPVLADVLVFVIAIVVVKMRPAGLVAIERS